MCETTKKRGGKREGAGRKKTSSKSIALRIPQDIVEILEKSGMSTTEYICNAIRFYNSNCGH